MKTAFITGMAIWLWSASVSAQSSAVLVGTVQEPGLNVTNIETAAGKIKVYLPQKIEAGDRISGTVSQTPSGHNEKEVAKNQAYLQGCVVELEDQPATKSRLGILGFIAPSIGSTLFALLRDDKGKTLARFPISIQKPQNQTASNAGFELPALAQSGRSLPIPGSTDGDLSNSIVQIGNRFYQPIAESPDEMVIHPATDAPVGLQPIRVQDGEYVARGEIRVVTVQIEAGRLNLLHNEATSVVVRVRGLESLKDSLVLKLSNETPGSVRLGNGNTQAIKISPGKVKLGGTFEIRDVIFGVGLGGFVLAAAIEISQKYVTCGLRRSIFRNSTDGVSDEDVKIIHIVTIDVSDYCKDKDSKLELFENDTSVKSDKIEDESSSVIVYKVAPGGEIFLTCNGEDNGSCSYNLKILTLEVKREK